MIDKYFNFIIYLVSKRGEPPGTLIAKLGCDRIGNHSRTTRLWPTRNDVADGSQSVIRRAHENA